MNFWTGLVFGLFIGSVAGVFTAALLSAGREFKFDDELRVNETDFVNIYEEGGDDARN